MVTKPDAQDSSILKELEMLEQQEALRHGAQWKAIEENEEFRRLISAKRRFIIPATIFFILYYFALPILVGYFPELMEIRVVGKVNLAYLFALSQFLVAWILAYLYVKQAGSFDKMAARIVEKAKGSFR